MNKVIVTLIVTLVINAMLASPQKTLAKAYNEPLTTAANRTEDYSMYIESFKGNNMTVLWIFIVVWPLFIISISLFCCICLSSGESTNLVNCELIIFLLAFLNIGFLVTLFVPKKSFLGIKDVIINGFSSAIISALLFNANTFIYGRLKNVGMAWTTFVRHLMMLQAIVGGFVCGGIAYWKGKDLNPNQALNYLWAIIIVGIFIAVSSCPLFIANCSNAGEDDRNNEDCEKSSSVKSRISKSSLNTQSALSQQQSATSQYSTQQSSYSGVVSRLSKESRSMKGASTNLVTKEPSKDSTFLALLNKNFPGVKTISGYGKYMLGQRNQRPVTEKAKKESKIATGESKLAAEDKKKSKMNSPSRESTGSTYYKELLARGKVMGKEVTSYSVYGPGMFKK